MKTILVASRHHISYNQLM